MPYILFHELCPEAAKKETRTVFLPQAMGGLPAGSYDFVEMFCDEPDCDCRRVMFSVFSSARKKIEAVIAWGWESAEFYKRWLKIEDDEMIKEMIGPVLNLGSYQSEYAPIILNLFATELLADPAYVARLKRHYAEFREKIGSAKGVRKTSARMSNSLSSATRKDDKTLAPARNGGGRVGRNEPCPCGSGKKFKVCCMRF
jgi:hypothetical protein